MTDENQPEPAGIEGALVIVERIVNPYVVCFHEPNGFRAEQVRALRSKLVVMNPDAAARTLVVTSSIQGEGKSSTTLNLAIALAELENHRVLVVDADLRNPSVEEYLGLNRQKGLVELLMGNVGLESVVRPTGINNLEILGSGLRPRNPSELLASRRIDELIGQLKQEYSYVIFDTPPVMPITDAGVLSARCDGTLIVVALEKATRKLVKEAVRHLQEMGANILGTFVTGIRSADPSYDQRYYSYYYTDKEGEDQ